MPPQTDPETLAGLTFAPGDNARITAAFGTPRTCVLRVTSESLAPGHVRVGDYLVIKRAWPTSGDVVLATTYLEGDPDSQCVMRKATLRRDDGGESYVELTHLDSGLLDFVGGLSDAVCIHGVVVGLIRRY